MNKRLQKTAESVRTFFLRHKTTINHVLFVFPLISLIPILIYGVFHPEADMDLFFLLFPFAMVMLLCGVAKQHYGDLRDEKSFRDTLKKADEAILILREHHKRQDERHAMLEQLNTGIEKMLDELYLELITRSAPASRN